MTCRQSFLRLGAGTCVLVVQFTLATLVFGQTTLPATRQPLVVNSTARALASGRNAFAKGDWAKAYSDFRIVLKGATIGSPEREEALRGFSEAGMKLAQKELDANRPAEARRIARSVLAERPDYDPALELIRQTQVTASPTKKSAAKHEARAKPTDVWRTEPASATGTIKLPTLVREEANPPPQPSEEAPTSSEAAAVPSATAGINVKQPLVRVYFATDRLPSGEPGPSNYFGVQWNKDGDHLFTGYVTVSIPQQHEEGKVERPFKWWLIKFSEDPKKHFVLTELKAAQGNDFYQMLRDEYGSKRPEDRSAFVFIHGFNVTFDDAAYRTAQLAYDLNYTGVPIMYSWPSQGRLLAYNGDYETVDWSSPHLQAFLERVARESGAQHIHLVAHSMGNHLLANALMAVGREPDIKPLFDNVIMAAPDVNAYTFTDEIWPQIKVAAKRFTLYASSDDQALKISKESKGPNDFDRLGEAGAKIVVISGLDTVDASGIDTSLLGHSYVDSCKPVMTDLELIMQKGFAPLQRKLHSHDKQGLAYWTFQ